MFGEWKTLVVIFLAVFALVLTLVNFDASRKNRYLQREVLARQQLLNQAAQLRQFNAKFIKALANLSAQTNDENIRRLLADHGVTFTVTQPAAEMPRE